MANAEFPRQVLIFGCGNMGGAMLRGWIASGVDPACFAVVDPFVTGLPEGVKQYHDASEVTAIFDVALLGIKPQMLSELAPAIAALLAPGTTLISILAGARCAALERHFPTAHIVRLMPNLAAAIGKSPLGLWSPDFGPAEKSALESWLAPLGRSIWLNDEAQMDAVTALAGSGPAFVYRFIDALGAAGTQLGIVPEVAAQLALSMVEGAALLAAQSRESPAELAARVTSPGGTTAAGLNVLDKGNALAILIEETLRAATQRGAELAEMGTKA